MFNHLAGMSEHGYPVAMIMATGRQLRAGRALRNISRRKLAGRAGVAERSILRAEAVDDVPAMTIKTIQAIQGALEVQGVEFFADGVPVRLRRA